MHPILKELLCAVVIAVLTQGIESIRERNTRKPMGFPDHDYWT